MNFLFIFYDKYLLDFIFLFLLENKMSKQPVPRPPPPVNATNQATTSSSPPATTPKPKRAPILPNDIKCILLQGYGSLKQMKCISIPRPTPGDGEVLVHVKSWFV